jgi:GAF domain-containing protein
VPFRRIRDIERLHALVDAMLLVDRDLELPVVLRTIVETAVEVVGARYGALGVLDEAGTGLSQFVYVGIDDAQADAIGHLPKGIGILGLLIKEPNAVRLADLSRHPESTGFPQGHPPMHSFLGVPVRVGGEAFGNLYLTEKRGQRTFTEEDEHTVAALALAAGLAIGQARLHARIRDLTLGEERERIGHDLLETTVRRLFAVGLSLQSAERLMGTPEAAERLRQAIDELDDTIRQVRTTVFSMTHRAGRGSSAGRGGADAEIAAPGAPTVSGDTEVPR